MDSQKYKSEEPHALRHHGGNINAAQCLFPDAPKPWIDLSTGINPIPYPVGPIASSVWTKLPDPIELAALEAAARTAYGAKPSAWIVAAPGMQALIQWLPPLFPAQRVGVLGVTYQEHETSWRAAGADVTIVTALADLAAFDIGLVVNPNNPDGRTVAPIDLYEIAITLAHRGGRLIVDEAFMDVPGRQGSLVPYLPVAGAIALRSFGKAYGLAGIRLGFAVGSPEDCMRLRRTIGPWAVSGPAIEIGRRALMDDLWLTETVERLHGEANQLDKILESVGLKILGGTLLFRLVQHREAGALCAQLCRAGILTRPFQMQPSWLRIRTPHASEEWLRLESTLRSRIDFSEI